MYASIIKMATLHEASRLDWDGKPKPFWGLVQQNGPWKTTPSDVKRSEMKDQPSIGGGKAAGGRQHAGHGEWLRVLTPYQIDATGPIVEPSSLAMRSVLTGPVDMKRQTKMGRVKHVLTLGARTPAQTGQKMGLSTKIEKPVSPLPSPALYGSEKVPVLEQIAPLLADHQVAETEEMKKNILSEELHRETPSKRKSSLSLGSIQKRQRTWGEFGKQVAAGTSGAALGFIIDNVPGAVIGAKKAWDYTAPDLEKDNITQLHVKVEEPKVTTFKPPHLDQGLSTELMKDIAKHEEGRIAERKSVMEKRKGSIMEGIVKKVKGVGKPGPSLLGKRKGSDVMEVKKKVARTIFKGPIHAEQHNIALKRKAEKQIMSEKFKQTKTKEPKKKLKVNTQDLGAPFVGRIKTKGARAEKKSAPKKNDILPEERPKRR